MKILFTVIPEMGHINPTIGPALHLQKRHHQVSFYALNDISAVLQRAGLQPMVNLHRYEMAEAAPEPNHGPQFAANVRDDDWLRLWIKQLLVTEAEAHIPLFREAIRKARADIVVTDPMLYAAIIAAHEEGVPWVALSNSLNPVLPDDLDSALLQTVAWLAEDRALLFSRHGMSLQFRGCDAISPALTIAFATSELIGCEVNGVTMVGPSLPPGIRGDETPFPWDRIETNMPVLYMSLGSQIYYQPRMFNLVVEAISGMPLQLVLSAGELHNKLDALPSNAIALPYVPQLQLLPHVRAMITHGGANSVMEALSFGIPLLCSPICNDQFHQAHFLVQSGAGLELDLSKANGQQVRSALESLLHAPAYRENAKRIASSYSRNGAFEAALLIENVCN